MDGDNGCPIRGSATEGALLEAARRHGLDYREVRNAFPLAEVWPRAEGQNWMATRHRNADGYELVAVKGAPEEVLQRSTRILGANGHPRGSPPKVRREILTANARMADQAMRVLGTRLQSSRRLAILLTTISCGSAWSAWPIRSARGYARPSLPVQRAGMRIVMLTGDQSGTAIAVGPGARARAQRQPAGGRGHAALGSDPGRSTRAGRRGRHLRARVACAQVSGRAGLCRRAARSWP